MKFNFKSIATDVRYSAELFAQEFSINMKSICSSLYKHVLKTRGVHLDIPELKLNTKLAVADQLRYSK